MYEEKFSELIVIGLSTVTSHKTAHADISNLWNEFNQFNMQEKLSKIKFPAILAVYSDYEDGVQGRYRTTIGYAVEDQTTSLDGEELVCIKVPEGQYQTFRAKSAAPQDILAIWQEIWKAPLSILNRNFLADYEIYHEHEAFIRVGVHPNSKL